MKTRQLDFIERHLSVMLKTMDSGVKMPGSYLYPVTYWLTEVGQINVPQDLHM